MSTTSSRQDQAAPSASCGARSVSRHSGSTGTKLGPNVVGREHDESDTGQEEVNVVISGSGVYRIEGDEIPVRPGTFLRFDSETTRVPIAGPDGLTMIAVGARRGSYEPRGPF